MSEPEEPETHRKEKENRGKVIVDRTVNGSDGTRRSNMPGQTSDTDAGSITTRTFYCRRRYRTPVRNKLGSGRLNSEFNKIAESKDFKATRSRSAHMKSVSYTESNEDERSRNANNLERRERSVSSRTNRETRGKPRHTIKQVVETQRENQKREKTKLYVVFREKPSLNADISGYLWNRMGLGSDSDMSFSILETEDENIHASKVNYVIIELPSYKLAKTAHHLLTESNTSTNSDISCFFTASDVCKWAANRAAHDQSFIERSMNEIVAVVKENLNNHDKKIGEASKCLQDVVDMLRRKGLSIHEFNSLISEREAREDKLHELELQRKEFTSYVRCINNKLHELEKAGMFKSHINEVRKSLGIEYNRLESALPMYARREQILNVVRDNQVCVIIGETGSGKSTQMAQYIYQADIASEGIIACTQPRKIAAVSLATHVSSELASSVGHTVGYKVGMKSRKTTATKIMYMTDHTLLFECLHDENLSSYSCIIIDEAHERSIYTDLLLGMLKQCLKNRPKLKVIVTSATINPDVFVSYFGGNENCPVLQVSGRKYPVQCLYETKTEFNRFPDEYEKKAVDKAIEIHKSKPIADGGVLVFLTSAIETEKSCTHFKTKVMSNDFICLPLHGKLQMEQQQLAFKPPPNGKRNIIFATNCAETSVTIPGIKFVVDSGVAKEMRFDSKKNMNNLSVVTVSQSSADQRKGRAGRTGPGVCYRLYSDTDFKAMSENGKPEILRIHLGHGLLTLLDLGVNPTSFDFVEPPPTECIDNAMRSLRCIGAVSDMEITDVGKWLAKMPVEPSLAVIIKHGIDSGVSLEGIVVAACCTSGAIFFRAGTDEEKKKADRKKIRFCHSGGDVLTMLNVYREWSVIVENAKGRWCKENSINGKTMRAVHDLVKEILLLLKRDMKLDIKHELRTDDRVDDIVQNLIFRSMKGNLCYYLGHEQAGYITCERQQHVSVHPSSSLLTLGTNPTWVVFGQLLQTSDYFITNITPVSEKAVDEALAENEIHVERDILESQQLSIVRKVSVGKYVNFKFIGPMHRNRRQFQEKMSMSFCGNQVVIDSDNKQGYVTLYTVAKNKTEAENMLLEELLDIAAPLKKEMREEKLGSDSSGGVRAVLQNGIAVRDILMPENYRVVQIKQNMSSKYVLTESDITEILSQYGPLENVISYSGKQQGIFWGRAIFADAADAPKATHGVNDDLAYGINLVPVKPFGKKVCSNEFTIKLTWCRRKARGIAYVYLERPEDQARLQAASPFIHDGALIEVNGNRVGEATLYVKGLRPGAKEDDLKQSLANSINVSIENNKSRFRIVIPRENVAIDANEINSTCREISDHISVTAYIDRNTFRTCIKEYKAVTAHVTAFVHFRSQADCQAALDCLHGFTVTTRSLRCHATMDLHSTFHVRRFVYVVTQTELMEYIAKREAKGSSTRYSIKILKSGNAVIDINSISIERLAKARLAVQTIVEGDTFERGKHSHLSHVFTRDGRQHIQKIEKQSGTLIIVNQKTESITIHGSMASRMSAAGLIFDFLEQVKNAHEARISLKGDDNPPGMMKHMILKFGMFLDLFKTECGLQSVVLNFRTHVIVTLGSKENVAKAVALVDKIRSEVSSVHRERTTDLPDCPICLCPVDDDVCMLEYCGHAYCKVCLNQVFLNAVKDKTFPIKCAADGCETMLVIRDLNNQIAQDSVNIKSVTSAAVNCFVEQNKNAYRYCISPDCEMVYRVTKTEEPPFTCSQCEVRICTTCHVQYHDGMSCAMYNGAKDDDGSSVDAWIKKNKEKRKRCPQCKIGIEKIEGCNHMTCKCGVHICWVCLAFFTDSQKCYGHLDRHHGSFV